MGGLIQATSIDIQGYICVSLSFALCFSKTELLVEETD